MSNRLTVPFGDTQCIQWPSEPTPESSGAGQISWQGITLFFVGLYAFLEITMLGCSEVSPKIWKV